jgi:2'-5' RNA ligase
MRYFVGYLTEGEIVDYHTSLIEDIKDRFEIDDRTPRSPTHITLYRPFGEERLEDVGEVISQWIKRNKIPGIFKISGFGKFDEAVIFIKPEPDASIINAVTDLRNHIENIQGMVPQDFPTWNPHITIIRKQPPEIIKQIWQYLSSIERPEFVVSFDNVSIFRLEEDRHVVHQKFLF